MKHITKLAKAKFKVFNPAIAGSELELDFNPIIEEFKLSGNYCLIHWQARPKGDREWGIYVSKEDRYYSTPELRQNVGCLKSLQLDDKSAKTLPSAVLFSSADNVTCINDKTIIGDVMFRDLS